MGVPKFFRYISERYPCLSEAVHENKIPEFDNLYLDMNGIIHNCTHPEDFNAHFRKSEPDMMQDIFSYIDKLIALIRPKKLFFMAVDGVAPRAKMNQQRTRRFRSAKEAEILRKIAEGKGEQLPDTEPFDTNCITPGTEFMARLHAALEEHVKYKISTSDLWSRCRIILSGHQTPGEGEHKIMEYIRFMQVDPNYDINTRHCLYGLDADLIMLGLCTHERNFSLLREKVNFGRKATVIQTGEEFFLLHLGLLKEYLELEFAELKNVDCIQFDIEYVVDDWILMGFLVGNDFIPHLPNFHITSNALPVLHQAYIKVMPQMRGYINENGVLNLQRFEIFMKELAVVDKEMFRDLYTDLKYLEAKPSNDELPEAFDFDLEDMKQSNTDLAELVRNSDMLYENNNDDDDDVDWGNDEEMFEKEFALHKRNYYINKLNYHDLTPEVIVEQTRCYIEALQWILYYYYKGISSWGWFYPHHYAPFASDVQNFKHLKLEFELGEPFLPFEQLLAVLPASSRNLLPQPFRDLMTSPESEIINYYPVDFKTDLNGKLNEWEAVVLIPFINENVLIKSMQPHLKNLTQEENDRNRPGPMVQYKGSGVGKEIWRDQIVIKKTLRRKISNKTNRYTPGFPTMRHLEYTGELRKARVRVFDQPSKGDNMFLLPKSKYEGPNNLDIIAKEYIDKVVFIGWPHMIESKVIAVSNDQFRIDKTGKHPNTPKMHQVEINSIAHHHRERMGVDFGNITILVHAVTKKNAQYYCIEDGTIQFRYTWEQLPIAYPLNGVVADIKSMVVDQEVPKIETIYPINSKVLLLTKSFFGCDGIVLCNNLFHKSQRIEVAITVQKEPNLLEAKQKQIEMSENYVTLQKAAHMLNGHPHHILRITSVLLVIPGTRRNISVKNAKKVNIALRLRFQKTNEELCGFTRRVDGYWLFSKKAVDLINDYEERFQILTRLAQNPSDVLFESDIFPYQDNTNRLAEITNWIKTQSHIQAPRVQFGTRMVEPCTVHCILDELNKLKGLPVKYVRLEIKAHLLLSSYSNLPEPYKPLEPLGLLDRVVVCKCNYQVPVGYRGTIVGVHPSIESNPVRIDCVNAVEMYYDVLFDKTFHNGNDIYGIATNHVLRVSESSIMPIYRRHDAVFNSSKPKIVTDPPDISIVNANQQTNNKAAFVDTKYSEVICDTAANVGNIFLQKLQNENHIKPNSPQSSNLNPGRFSDNLFTGPKVDKLEEGTEALKKILGLGDISLNEPTTTTKLSKNEFKTSNNNTITLPEPPQNWREGAFKTDIKPEHSGYKQKNSQMHHQHHESVQHQELPHTSRSKPLLQQPQQQKQYQQNIHQQPYQQYQQKPFVYSEYMQNFSFRKPSFNSPTTQSSLSNQQTQEQAISRNSGLMDPSYDSHSYKSKTKEEIGVTPKTNLERNYVTTNPAFIPLQALKNMKKQVEASNKQEKQNKDEINEKKATKQDATENNKNVEVAVKIPEDKPKMTKAGVKIRVPKIAAKFDFA